MRHTIKLIHPEYGCVKHGYFNYETEARVIIKTWQKLYGKKFNDCVIEKPFLKGQISPDGNVVRTGEKKKIINLKTGDIYYSIAEAAKDLNVHKNTIGLHLSRRLKGHAEYLVKYAN
jgi:hypothetical protein